MTSKFLRYRVLISGILSPILAVVLYVLVYSILTSRSSNVEKDWLVRLSLATLAMTVPFLFTLAIALREGRHHELSLSTKIGLAIAFLSLALIWKPVSDGVLRSRQVRNMELRDVAAPLFETTDISGKTARLADEKGRVVLVNIWATWCEPCRDEMPKLDQLYRERKDQGFVVFGLSDEDAAIQQKYLKKVPVSYPLLTLSTGVPRLYRDIARYPAIFLVDRQGRLQPAPGPGEPFEKLETAVDSLLNSSGR